MEELLKQHQALEAEKNELTDRMAGLKSDVESYNEKKKALAAAARAQVKALLAFLSGLGKLKVKV